MWNSMFDFGFGGSGLFRFLFRSFRLFRWFRSGCSGGFVPVVSGFSTCPKVSILSILAKSIGNSIPLEPAMFLVSIAEQSLNTS